MTTTTPNPGDVTSVWALLGLAIVVGIPAFFSWLNSRQAKLNSREANAHAQRGADELEHQMTPNSGKSFKDSLNRIEANVKAVRTDVREVKSTQTAQAKRLKVLEDALAKNHPDNPEASHGVE